MNLKVLKGRISTLGPSIILANGGKVYDYIQFIDETGAEVYARKVVVEPNMDSNLSPGISGTFLVKKYPIWMAMMTTQSSSGAIGSELCGMKTEGFECTSVSIAKSSKPMNIVLGVCGAVGVLIAFGAPYIGIPIVALVAYAMFFVIPKNQKIVDEVVKKEGFTLVKAKEL